MLTFSPRVTHYCVVKYLKLVEIVSTEETFLPDFLVILKRLLQNYQKIGNKCSLAAVTVTNDRMYVFEIIIRLERVKRSILSDRVLLSYLYIHLFVYVAATCRYYLIFSDAK